MDINFEYISGYHSYIVGNIQRKKYFLDTQTFRCK